MLVLGIFTLSPLAATGLQATYYWYVASFGRGVYVILRYKQLCPDFFKKIRRININIETLQ